MSVAVSAPPLFRDQRLEPLWDKVQAGERLDRDERYPARPDPKFSQCREYPDAAKSAATANTSLSDEPPK